MKKHIDELDLKILKCLQKNARKSFREIAKSVNSTTVTVINRIRNLEKKRIIKGYTVMVDLEKLGFSIHAIIEIKAKSNTDISLLSKTLLKTKHVFKVYEVSGENDIISHCVFKSMKDMKEFVENFLKKREEIAKTVTHVIFSTKERDITQLL